MIDISLILGVIAVIMLHKTGFWEMMLTIVVLSIIGNAIEVALYGQAFSLIFHIFGGS